MLLHQLTFGDPCTLLLRTTKVLFSIYPFPLFSIDDFLFWYSFKHNLLITMNVSSVAKFNRPFLHSKFPYLSPFSPSVICMNVNINWNDQSDAFWSYRWNPLANFWLCFNLVWNLHCWLCNGCSSCDIEVLHICTPSQTHWKQTHSECKSIK